MNPGAKAVSVELSEDELKFGLLDGRTIIVPLAWYPRLLHATPEQRTNNPACDASASRDRSDRQRQCASRAIIARVSRAASGENNASSRTGRQQFVFSII
jgi:hypothetical protein